MQTRIGARSRQSIAQDILEKLNAGELASANLVEWLAIDQIALLKSLLASQRETYLKAILQNISPLKNISANKLCQSIGAELWAQSQQDRDFLPQIAQHPADMVRCWAAYAFAARKDLDIERQLMQMQPFAADPHFAVREIAWLAVRADIAQNLAASLQILLPWTAHQDENVRRFACEATRPRGVWCAHINELKNNPSLALPLLEALKTDRAKYVQLSLGNWLNDAGKTCPDFVETLCQRWQNEGNTAPTIIKRALRNLHKKSH